jgi:aldehyde:ferredoxin oxidoreductase
VLCKIFTHKLIFDILQHNKSNFLSFDEMLDEYYEARGWNSDGIPTAAKLKELGLPVFDEGVSYGS